MEKLPFDEEALVREYEPDFAFAYGSGVFRQAGYEADDQPMIDLVFGVNDSEDWHRKNMLRQMNDSDHSFILMIMPPRCADSVPAA